MDNKNMYRVKNRSAGRICYMIPEDGVTRGFNPGETKLIGYDELLKLTYQPGGREIMANFLQIQSEKILTDFNIPTQPEYDMSEQQIIELLKSGSYEQFLDCLDYAPVGVIDLVKKYSVELPLGDLNKREALKNKTGFDVETALKNKKAELADEPAAATASTPQRRTNVSYKTETPAEEAKPAAKIITPKT